MLYWIRRYFARWFSSPKTNLGIINLQLSSFLIKWELILGLNLQLTLNFFSGLAISNAQWIFCCYIRPEGNNAETRDNFLMAEPMVVIMNDNEEITESFVVEIVQLIRGLMKKDVGEIINNVIFLLHHLIFLDIRTLSKSSFIYALRGLFIEASKGSRYPVVPAGITSCWTFFSSIYFTILLEVCTLHLSKMIIGLVLLGILRFNQIRLN